MKDDYMLNNKGFTLVEVVATIVIISLISIVILNISKSTFSINKEKAYEIMKNNIYKVSETYIKECDTGQLSCDLNWNHNSVSFYADKLKNAGYYNNLNSPIDDKDIGKCLLIRASKDNGVINIELVDDCY